MRHPDNFVYISCSEDWCFEGTTWTYHLGKLLATARIGITTDYLSTVAEWPE